MNHLIVHHSTIFKILLLIASLVVGSLLPMLAPSVRWPYIHGSLIGRGRKVLFVDEDDLDGTVRRGYASTLQKRKGADYIYVRHDDYYARGSEQHIGVVRFDACGTAWCFGWEGEAADALRAAVALGESSRTATG